MIGIGMLWVTKLPRVAMFESVVLRPPVGPAINLDENISAVLFVDRYCPLAAFDESRCRESMEGDSTHS